MALSDAERITLVEELSQLFNANPNTTPTGRETDAERTRSLADACLPVIDRMLAARDLDELLSDLEWLKMEGLQLTGGRWWASITVSVDGATKATRQFRGEGDTPTQAIVAAIRAARETVL